MVYCTREGDDMEIRAKCRLDFDSIKALTHVSFYKKMNPKKAVRIRAIIWLVLLLVIVAEMIVFDFDPVLIICIVAVLLMIAFDVFVYWGLPRIQYKSLSKMKDAENDFLFTDTVLKAFTKSAEYNGEAEIEYSLFVKVYETSKYLFLYQTNNQVLSVDKSTIAGGSIEDIRNKLASSVKGKYVICKY